MKKKVYLETTIISYLTARPSSNLIVAAWQNLTWEWWSCRRPEFEIFISELVIEESGKGDADAAQRRLDSLAGIPLLKMNQDVVEITKQLISNSLLPKKAIDDAFHISLATVHGMDYLLTWNCRHIDNAETKPAIRMFFLDRGLLCPEICSPQELMGGLI